MTRPAACACGHEFEVADSLAGGIANCPRCGKAVEIPGLRDPAWRVLQAIAAVAGALATTAAYVSWGIAGAIASAVCFAAAAWVISRGF